MVQDLHFSTQVSGHTDQGMEIRGVPLEQLISEADFVATVFLSLTGRKPKPAEIKVLNAILVASIDHGIQPASGFVPRVVASSGNDILTAMAATLLALGPYHGGAISGAMAVLSKLHHDGSDKEAACQQLVSQYRQRKQRIPGYGHPHYKDVDPRTKQLFSIARKAQLDGSYLNLAEMLALTIEQVLGKKLVLNVDGAVAALLLALGIDPKAGNGIFGLARVAGSLAHIVEEQTSGDWVRRLPDEAVNYSHQS